MGRKTKFKILSLLYLFFQIQPLYSALHQAEAGGIGKYQCSASITVERAYDDNVLLTHNKREGSYISMISPSLSLTKTGKKIDMSLHYDAYLTLYDRYSHQDQRNHTGTFSIGIKPVNAVSMGIRGQDTYSSTKRDERKPSLADNTIKFNDFSITPYIEQKLSQDLGITLSYTFTEKKYQQKEDKDLEDSTTYRGAANIQWKLSGCFSLDGGYTYTFNDFMRTTPDESEQETGVGFTLNRESKIRVRGKYGYVWKEDDAGQRNNRPTMSSTVDLYPWRGTTVVAAYAESSTYSSSHDAKNDSFISHDASLIIRHDLLSRKITVQYGGTYNLSDYDSVDRVDKSYQGTVHIGWEMFTPLVLFLDGSCGKSWYTHDLTQRKDTSCGGGGGLELRISRSTTFTLHGNYTKTYYQPDSHQVELYDGNVKLAYHINKRILFEAGYRYLESGSNDRERQNYEEDKNTYLSKRWIAGLRAAF
ncbi:MAG: outer membrane beta-barrel protein [bacterium]